MYGCFIDGMNKIYNGHPCSPTKTKTNIQNDFGFSFKHFSCASHLQCKTNIGTTCIAMGVFSTTTNGLDQLLYNFLWVTNPLQNID